jgi:ribonuclease-3
MAKSAGEDVVKRAEKAIGFAFHNPEILRQALVHRSYLNEVQKFSLGSNERLEYLGDAVVEWVVTEHLFHRLPKASEGDLTAMRAALVRAQTLGRLARQLGLGDLLYLSRGEIETRARTRPRLLGQAFEALVGAIYLDQGAEAARRFILEKLAPELDRLERDQSYVDAKSRLQEIAQAEFNITPTYQLISATGSGHEPYFVVEARLGSQVIGKGEGTNKREAEQIAARLALKNWPPDRG